MKQQLVIKEAFGENTSRALQETARCSCFRNICGPASSGADSLGLVWFPVLVPKLSKAGAGAALCPGCAEPAAHGWV